MKGIILSGGNGTRMFPTTLGFNKHLLPIYNKPMLFYPLSTLMMLGCDDILITSFDRDLPLIQKILDDGSKLGINISYKAQKEASGIAEVLMIADSFVQNERFCMMLGDNIFIVPDIVSKFQIFTTLQNEAGIVLYQVNDPSRYGIAEVDNNMHVMSLEEKPKKSQV